MTIIDIGGGLLILEEKTRIGSYDFDFENQLACSHPQRLEGRPVILRCGAIGDYAEYEHRIRGYGGRLLMTGAEHELASDISRWYEPVRDLTPETFVFDSFPDYGFIRSRFGGECFIKGHRQTDRHRDIISVVGSEADYHRSRELFAQSDILHWQKVAIRRLLQIATKPNGRKDEYRTFWFGGNCVGIGSYWDAEAVPATTQVELMRLGTKVIQRLEIPFIVLDFVRNADGKLMFLECNDAQESGYCGVDPRRIWTGVIEASRTHGTR